MNCLVVKKQKSILINNILRATKKLKCNFKLTFFREKGREGEKFRLPASLGYLLYTFICSSLNFFLFVVVASVLAQENHK